jgi:chromate reductase, NAD(P)H dehydrogenase (quinone)
MYLNAPAMHQPEAYISGDDKRFDADGKLADDGTEKLLRQFMQAFANWVTAIAKADRPS